MASEPASPLSGASPPGLSGSPASPPRTLGTLDVVALGINCVVGSGIFLLPGLAAEGLGPASLLATLGAGTAAFLIALCFAEAGSRFGASGGAYVYARAAFGPLAGFLVGWIATLAGVVAWAALANAWTVAMAYFVPALGSGWGQKLGVLAFVATLGAVNLVGARPGARLSTVFTVAKLGALGVFVALAAPSAYPGRLTPFAPEGLGALPGAVLLMLYAYLGFENLVVPAGEMENPRRTLPRVVLAIMGAVTVLYLFVQTVVLGILPDAAGVENAVAEAARAALGAPGGALVAAGVVLSVIGVNAASSLILPRRLYALAEGGQLPPVLARVSPSTGTPAVSILVVHLATAAVALSGSFAQLAVLAVVARLFQYIPTCLAVLRFRSQDKATAETEDPPFTLPGGWTLPLLALGACALVLLQATLQQLLLGGVALLLGLPVYWLGGWLGWGRAGSRS